MLDEAQQRADEEAARRQEAEAEAARRMPGSLAVALAGVAQGMQMIRVHDVAETRQALRLWQAATRGYST